MQGDPAELASFLDVIQSAKARVHFEDFKIAGRLTNDMHKGYQARMSAFNILNSQGFVKLEAGFLALADLQPADWLIAGIENGDPESWQICEIYPKKARKFQPDQLKLAQIGFDGEIFCLQWLQQNLSSRLHNEIIHTSVLDDTAGYDIVFTSETSGHRIFWEVKTTTREGKDFRFYLSRNEWEVARKTSNWYIVLVEKIRGNYRFFGHLDGASLANYYPQDQNTEFSWISSSGRLTPDDVFPGVPGF